MPEHQVSDHLLAAEQLIGRAEELATFEAACLTAERSHRGTTLVISGQAGIGKTRLCEELGTRARARGWSVAAAHCWVDGGAPPLWPWQRLVTDLCGAEAADLLATDAGRATVDPERFARFAAVADRLAAACARAPTCLVIDDVHGADAGALLLARFLARSLQQHGLVVVLSRRTGEPHDDPLVAGLLDDIEAEATPVVLRPLDRDEAAALLAGRGTGAIDDGMVAVLHRVTGGNPLFLRRLTALGPAGRAGGLPAGLQAAIDRAVDALDPESVAILQVGAVLGSSASLLETAAVACVPPPRVLAAVEAAAATGLASSDGPDRFSFSHDLVRAAFEDRLSADERLDAHARAAAVVLDDGSPDRLARGARHALAAAPRSPDDGRRAVEACRAAARWMIAGFAYEQADALLDAATALHDGAGLGRAPAWLLVEWARAALLCGRLHDARGRFERAARSAQFEGDRVAFAEAAIGLGGVWLNERRSRTERGWVLAIQRAAMADLPADEEVLRCRLAVRLAAEAVYDGGPLEPVREALAAARRCGDPDAVTEALSLYHHAMLSPEHLDERLAMADELVELASAHGRGIGALMGLCWRTVDLFQRGDRRARTAFEDLRARADALACRSIAYIVDALEVMLLIRAGRLTEAEERAARCHDLGIEVGDPDAPAYYSAQLLAIRWMQGREAELADLADDMASSPTLVEAEVAFRATAADLAARAGRPVRARAGLDSLAAQGLAALPRSSTWLAAMQSIVEAAHDLGEAEVAREAYDLLEPFADLPVMPSLGVVCLGSTERPLGVAALSFGDVERAVAHLERAVVANRRLGNLPVTAIAQADLADALCHRDRPGDRARAAALWEEAAADAERMGMAARAESWRAAGAAVGALEDGAPQGRWTAARRQPGADAERAGALRREGRGWLVELDGDRAVVGDLVGMRYLGELLSHPGREIAVLTLAGSGESLVDAVHQPVLDDAARAAYAKRYREVAAELDEAQAHADLARAERLRIELDALVDELASATGLGGRARGFPRPAERARTAVRKAIKRALDEISAAQPVIGELLRSTISTGTTCSYRPDPAAPVSWSVALAPPSDRRLRSS